ncbi:hypothetical protein JW992_06435 [candidate division KSB1 bacterium]|nr:hypothetical protein [candidate division KSB1 bacterium]
MVLNLEELQRHYAELDFKQLEQIAFYEVRDLTADAVDILLHELRYRKRPYDYEAAIAMQLKGLPDDLFRRLYERLTTLPCPTCGAHSRQLNAALLQVSIGLLLTRYEKTFRLVACPKCIGRTACRCSVICALLGWWSVPHGFARTTAALRVNSQARYQAFSGRPSGEIRRFVREHSAEIVAKMNHTHALHDFLRRQQRVRIGSRE